MKGFVLIAIIIILNSCYSVSEDSIIQELKSIEFPDSIDYYVQFSRRFRLITVNNRSYVAGYNYSADSLFFLCKSHTNSESDSLKRIGILPGSTEYKESANMSFDNKDAYFVKSLCNLLESVAKRLSPKDIYVISIERDKLGNIYIDYFDAVTIHHRLQIPYQRSRH